MLALLPQAIQHVGDHVGNVAEFLHAEAARRARWRADADATGFHRRLRIIGNAILVTGDRRTLEGFIGIFARDAQRRQINKRQMRISAARNKIASAFVEARRHRFGIVDHGARIELEIGLQCFAEGNGFGSDDMHQWPALRTRDHCRVELLGERLIIGQDHTAARTAQCLMRRRCGQVRMRER